MTGEGTRSSANYYSLDLWNVDQLNFSSQDWWYSVKGLHSREGIPKICPKNIREQADQGWKNLVIIQPSNFPMILFWEGRKLARCSVLSLWMVSFMLFWTVKPDINLPNDMISNHWSETSSAISTLNKPETLTVHHVFRPERPQNLQSNMEQSSG